MPYTPVELRHVRVARAVLGYKREAVQDLLNEIADSFETVWRERHELADQLEEQAGELEELRAREQALTKTLVAAEQAAEKVKQQAMREAEVIIAEAHAEARAVSRNAAGERERLLAESKRIEALLRAALGIVEESAVERPAGWPQREDATAFDPADEDDMPEPASAQPQLRKVSGGFDWVKER